MAAWTEEEPLRKPKPARGGSGQASTGRRGGEGRGPEAGETAASLGHRRPRGGTERGRETSGLRSGRRQGPGPVEPHKPGQGSWINPQTGEKMSALFL